MKIVRRIVKWLFLSIFGGIFLVFLLLVLDHDAQSVVLSANDQKAIKVVKEYTLDVDSSLYDSLLETYGENKILAPGFELQCLLALAHYPELKKIPIDFLVQPAFIQLSARPDPLTVLLPWVKRKYLVVISNDTGREDDPILLEKAPFNEQVGIIGHELAHVVFYLDKNSLYLAALAYKYQYNDDFETIFERETDQRAIAHGLGYQLYDFAFFVRKAFGNTQQEIANETGDTYLSPGEIAEEMKKYKFYTDSLNAPHTYFTD